MYLTWLVNFKNKYHPFEKLGKAVKLSEEKYESVSDPYRLAMTLTKGIKIIE